MPLLSAAAASLHRDAFSLILKGLMTRRTRRLLILFVGLPGAFVTVVMLCLLTVIAFSGNLEPVRKRARADGIALSWAEAGRVLHPEHEQLVSDLESIASRLVFHAPGTNGYISTLMVDGVAMDLRDLDKPIAESFAKIYLEPTWDPIPDVDTFLDRMGHDSMRVEAHPEEQTEIIRDLHRVVVWLTYQCMVRQSFQSEDLWRICDLVDGIEVISMSGLYAKVSIFTCIGEMLTRYSAQMQSDPALADRLRASTAILQGDPDRMLEGQLILLNEALDQDPFVWAHHHGIPMVSLFEFPGLLRSYHRLGRVSLLNSRCDRIRSLHSGTVPTPMPALRFGWLILGRPGMFLERAFYGSLCTEVSPQSVWFERHVLGAQVMAEILTRNPLPHDPHGGGALKYEITDGRVTKVWSVGQNGSDNHSGGDDVVVTVNLSSSHPSLGELGIIAALPVPAAEHPGEGALP